MSGITAGAGSPVQIAFQRAEYAIVEGSLVNFNPYEARQKNTVANRRLAADQMKSDLEARYSVLTLGAQSALGDIDKWVNYR